MNLFYRCVLFSIAVSTVNFAHAATDPDVFIKGVKADASGLIYSENGSLINVDVLYSNNGTQITQNYFTPCLELPSGGVFDALKLSTKNGYIDIVNKGGLPIEKVQYIGLSESSAYESGTVCAISTDGVTFPTDNYSNPEAMPQNINKAFFFQPNVEDICREFSITVPDTIYQGFFPPRTAIVDFRKTVKTVRLTWSSSFGGISITSNYAPEIYGIKIWFKKDTSVGIGENQADRLTISRTGDTYTLSQSADILVYNINGRKIIEMKNSDNFSLEGQTSGIYILRAKTSEGIIIRKIVY